MTRYANLLMAIGLGAGIALGSVGAPVQAAEELRLGGVHSPTSFETQALERFAELVAEKTGGELTIQVFPAGQLGEAVSQIENVMLGAQDMFANVADWNEHLVKDYAIMGMPFAFTGVDHVKRFIESEHYAEMKRRMIEEKGIRVLGDNFYRLPRVLVTKAPVESLEDIQGLKMRLGNIDAYLETWKALGAKPTVIPWAESYLALRTGVVDGLDSPLSSVYPQKFYQAAKYVTMTNHSAAPFNILISERIFQGLSEAQQSALIEAAREAGEFYTQAIAREFKKQKAEMEADGVTFAEIDVAPFVERARAVAKEFESQGRWPQGLFDKVQNL